MMRNESENSPRKEESIDLRTSIKSLEEEIVQTAKLIDMEKAQLMELASRLKAASAFLDAIPEIKHNLQDERQQIGSRAMTLAGSVKQLKNLGDFATAPKSEPGQLEKSHEETSNATVVPSSNTQQNNHEVSTKEAARIDANPIPSSNLSDSLTTAKSETPIPSLQKNDQVRSNQENDSGRQASALLAVKKEQVERKKEMPRPGTKALSSIYQKAVVLAEKKYQVQFSANLSPREIIESVKDLISVEEKNGAGFAKFSTICSLMEECLYSENFDESEIQYAGDALKDLKQLWNVSPSSPVEPADKTPELDCAASSVTQASDTVQDPQTANSSNPSDQQNSLYSLLKAVPLSTKNSILTKLGKRESSPDDSNGGDSK